MDEMLAYAKDLSIAMNNDNVQDFTSVMRYFCIIDGELFVSFMAISGFPSLIDATRAS